jgi:hypothetical protein
MSGKLPVSEVAAVVSEENPTPIGIQLYAEQGAEMREAQTNLAASMERMRVALEAAYGGQEKADGDGTAAG